MQLPKVKSLLRVIRYIRNLNPKLSLTGLILQILGIFIDIYAIGIGGKFLDSTARYLTETEEFSMLSFVTSDSFYYLLFGLGLALLSYIFSQVREYINDVTNRALINAAKTVHIEKIASMNMEDIESKEFRDLLTMSFHFGINQMWNTHKTFSTIFQNLVRGISALTILFQYSGPIAFLIVLFALPEALIGYFSRKKIRSFHNSEIETFKWNDYAEGLATNIDSFSELKVNGTIKSLLKEYNERNGRYIGLMNELVKHMFIDISLFSTLGKVFMVIFVGFVIVTSVTKNLTIGTFKAIYDYAYNVYSSAFGIMEAFFNINNQLEYATKYIELMDYKGFGDHEHGKMVLPKGTPDLIFREMDFSYPTAPDQKVLENINLEIKAGQKVLILGGDGSGRTTFIRVLCGLYKVVAGDYQIGPYSIRELQRGQLKKKLSVIFQEFVNYNMTLQRNITLSSNSKKINSELYLKAIRISGVDKLMKKYNISNNSRLGRYTAGGKDISPGFWQRIAIARMIYRNRDIFVLDEPFTFIDDEEEIRILTEFFKFVGKSKTVIFITREKRHAKLFDRVYRLDKGKLIES